MSCRRPVGLSPVEVGLTSTSDRSLCQGSNGHREVAWELLTGSNVRLHAVAQVRTTGQEKPAPYWKLSKTIPNQTLPGLRSLSVDSGVPARVEDEDLICSCVYSHDEHVAGSSTEEPEVCSFGRRGCREATSHEQIRRRHCKNRTLKQEKSFLCCDLWRNRSGKASSRPIADFRFLASRCTRLRLPFCKARELMDGKDGNPYRGRP